MATLKNDFTGMVGIITGASSGIGMETAKKLSSMGMKLVLHGRREARMAALKKELVHDAVVMHGDICEPGICEKMLDTAEKELGGLDLVFNNAGTMHVAPYDVIDVEKCCEMVRVNVEAAYRLALLTVKRMAANGDGLLVNTSSILGTKVRPTAGAYAGTKFAIEALTEGLRMELAGSGVKVSCIEPGLVQTELQREWDEPAAEKLGIDEPLQPLDIADTVIYLLSLPAHVTVPRIMVLPGDHAI